MKSIFAVAVVIIGGLVALGLTGEQASTPSVGEDGTVGHTVGTSELNIEFAEAGDFECPACRQFFPLLDQVKEEYSDQIVFSYIHFPLTAIHQNALAAHRAAEAASRQGQFWAFHDLLYENQEDWNGPSSVDPIGVDASRAIEIFEDYAVQLELDIEQYNTDFLDPSTNTIINDEIAYARDKNASSTPTFFLNGERIDNSEVGSLDLMRDFLDNAIVEAGGTPPERTTDDAAEAESTTTNPVDIQTVPQ